MDERAQRHTQRGKKLPSFWPDAGVELWVDVDIWKP